MNYKIIDNISSETNHSARLQFLFSNSTSAIVASPYLMPRFDDFFKNINPRNLKELHLITTLQPNSIEQFWQIPAVINLFKSFGNNNNSVNCEVSINNRLHGKIYIFNLLDNTSIAIISSANFTNNGLSENHEWGVEIKDTEIIKKLEESLMNTITHHNISYDYIMKMKKKIDKMPKEKKPEAPRVELRLIDMINNIKIDEHTTVWLKPYGAQGMEVREDRIFTVNERAHFSKRRPTGVKINDILIIYGVGLTKILSICKVVSQPIQVSEEEKQLDKNMERWPWYVKTTNLTSKYGQIWSKGNLTLSNLVKNFLSIHPKKTITPTSRSYGALQFGQDKIKLSRDFAEFVIGEVRAIERKNS
jgi:hypothetical protein